MNLTKESIIKFIKEREDYEAGDVGRTTTPLKAYRNLSGKESVTELAKMLIEAENTILAFINHPLYKTFIQLSQVGNKAIKDASGSHKYLALAMIRAKLTVYEANGRRLELFKKAKHENAQASALEINKHLKEQLDAALELQDVLKGAEASENKNLINELIISLKHNERAYDEVKAGKGEEQAYAIKPTDPAGHPHVRLTRDKDQIAQSRKVQSESIESSGSNLEQAKEIAGEIVRNDARLYFALQRYNQKMAKSIDKMTAMLAGAGEQ